MITVAHPHCAVFVSLDFTVCPAWHEGGQGSLAVVLPQAGVQQVGGPRRHGASGRPLQWCSPPGRCGKGTIGG